MSASLTRSADQSSGEKKRVLYKYYVSSVWSSKLKNWPEVRIRETVQSKPKIWDKGVCNGHRTNDLNVTFVLN